MIPYPPKGGLLMRGYYLLRGLSQHHDVDLFAFNQTRLISSYYSSVREGVSDATDSLLRSVGSIAVEEIPAERSSYGRYFLALKSLISRDPYTINWLKSGSAKQRLRSLLSNRGYDIIHFDTISLAPYLDDVVGSHKLVLNHHNVESDMLIRRARNTSPIAKAWYYSQEGARLQVYERACLKKFDLHLACSEEDRRALLRIDPSLKVEVVPNVVLIPRQSSRRFNDKKKLLFVGGMDWYPYRDAVHHFLDEIWPVLSEVAPGVQVDFVGKRPSEKMLMAQKNDARLVFHGFVDDIARFYQEASAYICPIRDGGGTKLKVIDAMANAVPVVAYREACEGLNVTDGKHVLIARGAKEFSGLAARLISGEIDGEEIGGAAKQLVVERYSADSVGEIMSALYGSVCGAMRKGCQR
jgi:glycosyltransferase involved in cell wall biosynthesis